MRRGPLADVRPWARAALWGPPIVFGSCMVLAVHQTYVPSLRSALDEARWIAPLLLFIMGTATLRWYRDWQVERGLHIWAVLLIVLAFLSTFYSVDPTATFLRAGTLLVVYGAIAFGLYPAQVRRGPYSLMKAVVLAVVVVATLNVIPLAWPSVSFPFYGRYRGLMENPNTLGIFLGLFLPLVAHWGVQQRRRWGRFAGAGLIFVVVGTLMILSGSRTGILGAAVGLTYYGVAGWRLRGLAAATLLNVVLLAGSIGWTLALSKPAGVPHQQAAVTPQVTTEQESRGAETATASHVEEAPPPSEERTASPPASARLEHLRTLSGRETAWPLAIELVSERWLTGYGFGTEPSVFGALGARMGSFQGHYVHNSYLGMALQLGILGLVLFYAGPFVIAVRELRVVLSGGSEPLRLAAGGVLWAGLFVSIWESWPYSMGNAFSFPYWVTLACLWRWPRYP